MSKKKLLICIAFIFVLTLIISANAYAADDLDYLCFTAGEGGATISMEKVDADDDGIDTPTVYLEYSLDDKNTWENLTIDIMEDDTTVKPVEVSENGKIYFRADLDYNDGKNGAFAAGTEDIPMNNYHSFHIDGKVSLSGNIMSLLNADNFENIDTVPEFAFVYLFFTMDEEAAKSIVSIEGLRLPATNLNRHCYTGMFTGCTSLNKIPENFLSAGKLADYCYSCMFGGCTSLNKIPKDLLPKKKLAEGCYMGMFSNCTKLKEVPNDLLPAETLAENCYDGMFSWCTSLTKAPKLIAKQMVKSCYASMFDHCESLEEAPELPARKLAPFCYSWMFSNCDKLEESPSLPASKLCDNCYNYMFYGCDTLSKVTVYFADWGVKGIDECYPTEEWLNDTPYEGDFYCIPDLETKEIERLGMTIPEGWTIYKTLTPEIDFPWWVIPFIFGGTSSGSSSSSEPKAPVVPTASYDKCTKASDCPMYVYYDLDMAKWYHDGIHFCLDNGLMKGVGSYMFDPDGTTTRPMMVTILSRMDGCDTEDGATWDEVGKAWAKTYKISDGIPEEGNITREEFATMLYRYAQKEGKGFVGSWMFLLDFKDADKISSWADEAVHWCVMKGILQGRTGLYEGMLDPQATLTRAEASAMIQRFCEVK